MIIDVLNDKVIEAAERLGWSCSFDKESKYIEFEKYSPAGEDFFFGIALDDEQRLSDRILDYYESFDTEEHVMMWMEAKDRRASGVPSLRELVEDADEIEKMIYEMYTEAKFQERMFFEKGGMEQVVQEALKIHYGEHYLEHNRVYHEEVYADYRDEIGFKEAERILEDEHPMQKFYELLYEWYEDEVDNVQSEISEVIMEIIKEEFFPYGMDDSTDYEFVTCIEESVEVWLPEDHFLNQKIPVNIFIDSGDGNYDFTLNSVYPCYQCPMGEAIDDKAGIAWLAKQQGYTKGQLRKALEKGDIKEPKGFLESMRQEVINLPSHMSAVTFLVKMTFEEAMKICSLVKLQDRNGHYYDATENPYCGYIVIGKDTETGLYDLWSGGGSVLEIQLEKDVKIPVRFIRSALPDGSDGNYSVREVYGVNESLWRETLKEIHVPSPRTLRKTKNA